ncbi:MAG: hypothetical protein U0172_00780 [Nitrospiraceae bacterium]
MNLFGGRRSIDPDQAARIKTWAQAQWAVEPDTIVTVTELQCREPDCPPIETVIALLEGPGRTRQYTIHKPAESIEEEDVRACARKGELHDHA